MKFNFEMALAYLKAGKKVALSINDKTRVYYLEDNTIYCSVNEVVYKIKQFYVDAILSTEWFLKEE